MKNIIFICSGNTCRSPMAQGLCGHLLGLLGLKDISCSSAGLYTSNGLSAAQNAVYACAEIGVDIFAHSTHQLTLEEIQGGAFDYYIALDSGHFDALNKLALSLPEHPLADRILLLGRGISDPYGGNLAQYRSTRDEIYNALIELLPKLLGITIEQMAESHIEGVAELENTCFAHPWSKQSIEEELANPNAVFRVAVIDSKVVAYAGMHAVEGEGSITNVAVLPQFRRRGIAAMLLLSLEKGMASIALEVRKSNEAAIALYTKLGYKTQGVRKGFYRDPAEDALIMIKDFR
ncbi:MAG: ribosomal protein S18-alanine N-acetyltransferase [Oscillospiraceae bacterium]|nr:ribosomal protein S18-alanine N-acetyltransferase [Oscillospiraceae bacterium]